MVKHSKRMEEAKKLVNRQEAMPLDKAVEMIEKFPKVKFDESVEMHLHLNIDPKKAEQMVRGNVVLPHGTGKKVRLAVFTKGEAAQKARELGADYVGDNDLITKVQGGFLDFDKVLATPDMMRDLSKLGKILGPRGLMPTPKAGTVTTDIEKGIKEIQAGKIEFKTDKQGGIHVAVGKVSFPKEKLVENCKKVIAEINRAKPPAIKGTFIKSLFLSTTMGPSVKVGAV